MVAFDTSVALAIWLPKSKFSVPDAPARMNALVEKLNDEKTRILIPTPVLSELLVRAEDAGPSILQELSQSSRFRISPFDIRAAIDAAEMIGTALAESGKRAGMRTKSTDTWAKTKFNHQIIAIARVEGVKTIYSDDGGLLEFARGRGLTAIPLKEVPLPPSKTPLLDGLEDEL